MILWPWLLEPEYWQVSIQGAVFSIHAAANAAMVFMDLFSAFYSALDFVGSRPPLGDWLRTGHSASWWLGEGCCLAALGAPRGSSRVCFGRVFSLEPGGVDSALARVAFLDTPLSF